MGENIRLDGELLATLPLKHFLRAPIRIVYTIVKHGDDHAGPGTGMSIQKWLWVTRVSAVESRVASMAASLQRDTVG